MFITGIGTAVPPRRYTQNDCWQAAARTPQFARLAPRTQALAKRVLLNEGSGIGTRHLCLDSLDDVFAEDPDILQARFARHAPELATAAARRALAEAAVAPGDIDAVLVSTCTGYLCPGLTGYVSERLGLRGDVFGLDLVGQGCAAALPNMRTAESLIASQRASAVLSICVEVCSAAFYLDDDAGVLVSACLFGDAAGAAVLAARPRPGARRMEWKAAWSQTDPAQRDALRFEQRRGMLRNVLTPAVPALAGERAATLLAEALAEVRLARDDIRTWIWHAGGRTVLEKLCEATGLRAADVERSAHVLGEYGNVSSPFVYLVLERALRQRAPAGWWWMSSFGAGFSCHGALLSVS